MLRASCHLAAIYSSPLARARATASAIARHQRMRVDVCDALNEIDFGAWTGRRFAALDADPQWHVFNRARATATIPGGETAQAAQRRIVAAIGHLAGRHRGHTIALVSHAEIVRCALLHYRGESLDRYHQIEIAPASVSAVTVWPTGSHVLFINRCAAALGP
jgi:probable phosphoglycerate mutase